MLSENFNLQFKNQVSSNNPSFRGFFIGDEYSNEFKLLLEECVAIKYAVLIQSWLHLEEV